MVYASRDGNLTTEQYNRLKQELESQFQGAGNAGRPLLLEGGLDWKTMSMSPKDLDFIEAKHGAAREIALALGVPPMLLGIPGDNTFSNYQEANRTFWRQTVLPLVNRSTAALTEWLAPGFGTDLQIKPDLDNIDALSSERDAQWARLNAATFLSIDEKRAAIGYGPSPKGIIQPPRPLKDYNPDQPRDDFGQWTALDGTGDSSGTGDVLPVDGPQTPKIGNDGERLQGVADKPKDPKRYSVDLADEEKNGGHTIRDHVNISDAELKTILASETYRGWFATIGAKAEGAFVSKEAANDFVNRSLEANSDKVDAVVNGLSNRDSFTTRFGYVTGKEAFRTGPDDAPFIRDTYEVRVVIQRDTRAPNGYRVITAFPVNQQPK